MSDADLFEQALAIPDAAERAALLARACAGDAARRERLERLLAAHEEGTAWPERTIPEMLGLEADVPEGGDERWPADLAVDGIELLRLIGRGGFGEVHEGWQQGARRRVAVKVLRADRLDPDSVARFLREMRLAAALSHPGIAAVHAVGTARTSRGKVPCLVTELVTGARRLTEHAANLDLPGRVALITQVCRAMGHAHAWGVVHRDLKPGNILVGSDGVPKVIDFGWARATGGDFTQATSLTYPGMIAGTFQYMSPEQFDTDGRLIDARADVWSLGVIAYQLFAGRLPYDIRGLTFPAIVALVTKPSVPTLVSVDDSIPLPLSRIVDKCLRVDPADRYVDAGALAEDFERFAAGEAVRARGPTFNESVALLVRRHPAGSAAIAGLFLGLVVAVIGIGRARLAEHAALVEAERGRDEARVERETALHRLYSGNLLRVWQAAGNGDTPEARSLLAESIDIAAQLGIAGNGAAERPLELRCAEAKVEGALAVLTVYPGHLAEMDCSPDGRWIASCGGNPGWRLWDAESGTFVAEAEAGGPAVRLVRFAPDGRVFATVDEAGTVHVRKPHDGEVLVTLPEPARVGAGIVFSPDGAKLLTAGADHVCRLWNVADGTLAASHAGHRRHVTCMAWSPDGTTIATAADDREYRLWNATDGSLIASRVPHAAIVSAIAFSPDSTLVATASRSGSLRLWRYREREEDVVLAGHQRAILCLAFSPDGTVLATGSKDRTLRLWNVADGSPRGRPAAHDAEVCTVAFSPDSTRVIAGAADGMVSRWDTSDAEWAGYLPGHRLAIRAIDVSPGGERVTTAGLDGDIRLWRGDDPALHDVVATAREPVEFVQFAADARRLAVGTRDGTLALLDAWADVELVSLRAPSGVWETIAAAADLSWMAAGSKRGSILFWSPCRGIDRRVGGAHDGVVTALAFSPDGTRLVSAGSDGAARLWDPEAGEPVAELIGHDGGVTCVATSPDGTLTATGSTDGTVRVWRLADGAPVAVCKSMEGEVEEVAFAPDSAILAVACESGTVAIHDPRRGTLLEHVPTGLGRVLSVVFSPDGTRLATTHGMPATVLWDTSDLSVTARLLGHNVQTAPAVFSPDGTRVVLGGADGTLRLWDHARASPLVAAKSHPLTILATAVSPDGRLVASAGADGVVRIHGRRQGEAFAERQKRGGTGPMPTGPARIGETAPPPQGHLAAPANQPISP